MIDGITVRILGDFGPFSRMGKSIGYQLEIGSSNYLVDCGAPLFQQIGGHGLKKILGMFITHCHDDHKRWFSDLALFNMYAPDVNSKVFLLTSEDVHSDLIEASKPALEKSLSTDSKNIVDLSYEAYIDYRIIGPRARYRITKSDIGGGRTALSVTDRQGNVIGPDTAKIVISQKNGRPRLLFRDPDSREWVEPESFYSYSSKAFYEEDKNIYRGEGFDIEAIKAPVWHGVTGIGLRVRTKTETLIFSSDTIHDIELWKRLYSEKRQVKPGMSQKDFEAAAVIYGDINDYIERVWSRERYDEAVREFDDALVIHDISVRNSVVHTDYEKLCNTSLDRDMTILTHSPDRITSEWVLCSAGKTFRVKGRSFFEVVDNRLYPMNADVYHKEAGKYYVGYRSEQGAYMVHEKDGLLRFSSEDGSDPGIPLYKVDLYEDISGRYFPKIEKKSVIYSERADGRVEKVEFTAEGSRGKIVEDQRDRLALIKEDKTVR